MKELHEVSTADTFADWYKAQLDDGGPLINLHLYTVSTHEGCAERHSLTFCEADGTPRFIIRGVLSPYPSAKELLKSAYLKLNPQERQAFGLGNNLDKWLRPTQTKGAEGKADPEGQTEGEPEKPLVVVPGQEVRKALATLAGLELVHTDPLCDVLQPALVTVKLSLVVKLSFPRSRRGTFVRDRSVQEVVQRPRDLFARRRYALVTQPG